MKHYDMKQSIADDKTAVVEDLYSYKVTTQGRTFRVPKDAESNLAFAVRDFSYFIQRYKTASKRPLNRAQRRRDK